MKQKEHNIESLKSTLNQLQLEKEKAQLIKDIAKLKKTKVKKRSGFFKTILKIINVVLFVLLFLIGYVLLKEANQYYVRQYIHENIYGR